MTYMNRIAWCGFMARTPESLWVWCDLYRLRPFDFIWLMEEGP